MEQQRNLPDSDGLLADQIQNECRFVCTSTLADLTQLCIFVESGGKGHVNI